MLIQGGRLFEAGHLLNFTIFSKCSMFILQQNAKKYQSKVSVKYSEENSVLGEDSYYNLFTQKGGVGVSAYLSLIGRKKGWALIRGWALINFFCL